MKIKPIETQEQIDFVNQVMQEDGHGVPLPSHMVLDDKGTLRGAFSVAFAPTLFFWMDTHSPEVLLSYRAFVAAEAIIKEKCDGRIVLPLQANSPFYEFMQRLGYINAGECELLIKGI